MPNSISGPSFDHNFRLNTAASRPRTSSNRTFKEQFRSGLGSGVDHASSAFRQIASPIPGSAAFSAAISDAARNLNLGGPGGSVRSNPGSPSVDGDINSMQDEMKRTSNDLLDKQMACAMYTTEVSAKSSVLKAWTDTQKSVASKIG